MPGSENPAASPLTRKWSGRSSPGPQDGPQPDSKKARQLGPSQSFADDLKGMPDNEASSPRPVNGIDLNARLVFQFVDIQAFSPGFVLVFGVTEGGTRLLIHITNLDQLPPSPMTSKGSIEHFMRHYQIKAMSWMEIPALKFEEIVGKHKLSHNQVEFSARHNDMVFHSPQGAWDKSAPLRILSFDIETMVAPGNGFPRYQHEPIIQIGNMLKIKGESSPYSRCIFTLNTCPGIVGAEVKSYNTEVEMLLAWRDFVISNDPDIIVGHNIGCFDLPQLILRATVLLVPEFAILGRLKAVRAEAVPRPMNQRLLNEAPILAGRLQLDTWQYMSESTIPRTTFNKSGKPACDLNSVSLEFLGRKKEDISFTLINGLQLGRPEGRQRLAVYCLKDTHLPLLLVECPRLQCLDESIRAARLSPRFQYMPFSTYLRSGRRRY